MAFVGSSKNMNYSKFSIINNCFICYATRPNLRCVVNPDTLNLDPDPRNFGPIWIRIQDYSVNFEKIG